MYNSNKIQKVVDRARVTGPVFDKLAIYYY